MEQFTGVISKRFLTSFSTQQQSSANLGGEYDAQTGEPCDYDTRASGGGGVVGITDPLPPEDGGATGGGFIRCDFITIAEEVTNCYRSDIGDGPRCTTTTEYITKTHCYWVGPSQDVYDGNNCPDPETGEVGVLTLSRPTAYIASQVDLNDDQIRCLERDPQQAEELMVIIAEDGERLEDGSLTEESKITTKLIIDLEKANVLEGQVTSTYNNIVTRNLSGLPSFLPNMAPQFIPAHFAHYAMLKHENPGWSERKLHWNAFRHVLHTGFDIMGLVPGFGEVFDLANATVYAVSGDWGNAGLSTVSAIPFVGWTTTTAKWAKRVRPLANGKKVYLMMYNTGEGIVKFSYRGQLRKVLGLGSLNLNRAHHVIPWRFNEHPVIQAAAKSAKGWHPNDILNGAVVSRARHRGSHNRYDTYVETELNKILANYRNNLDSPEVYGRVKNLADNLKEIIQDNPNISINDLF